VGRVTHAALPLRHRHVRLLKLSFTIHAHRCRCVFSLEPTSGFVWESALRDACRKYCFARASILFYFATNGYLGWIFEFSFAPSLPAPIFNSFQSLFMVVRVTAFPCRHLSTAPFLQLSVVLSTAGDWGPIYHYSGAVECPPRLSYSPVLVPTSS
jgi:hypothetical protein